MSLAKFAADLEDFKSRLSTWEKRELAAARHIGRQLLIERDMLIEQASDHGANKRHIMRELPRPDIGAALALDIHEEAPVEQPAAADATEPAAESGDQSGKQAAE
jgi:hypothetical protein